MRHVVKGGYTQLLTHELAESVIMDLNKGNTSDIFCHRHSTRMTRKGLFAKEPYQQKDISNLLKVSM